MKNGLLIISIIFCLINVAEVDAQNTFPCDGSLYFFRDNAAGDSVLLSSISNYNPGPPVITDLCTLGAFDVNAMGANPVDGYLYFLRYNAHQLIRIDGQYNQTIACPDIAFATEIIGCFDNLGRYWLETAYGGGKITISGYDVNNCTVVKKITFAAQSEWETADIAYDVTTSHFWFATSYGGPKNLIEIDTNGVVLSETPITVSCCGGTAMGNDGNFYGVLGAIFYGFNITTSSLFVTDTLTNPSTFGEDMASFPSGRVATIATQNAYICHNDSARLNVTISPGSTYEWTPTANLSCNNCPDPVATPSVTTAYLVTATTPGGCISEDTVNVIVAPLAATAGPDTSVCSGGYVVLNAGGGTNYVWRPSTGLSDTSIANPVAYPTSSITYTVTVSTGTCVGTATVTLTSLAAPPPPVITQSNDTLFCSIDTSYTSFQWYGDSSFIPGATDTFLVVSQSGNYNAQVTNINGCSIAVGINVVLGIPTYSISNLPFTVSPNPAGNQFTIHNSQFTIKKIEMYNVLGEMCLQSAIVNRKSEIVVDVSSLTKGVYLIQIITGDNIYYTKVVKE